MSGCPGCIRMIRLNEKYGRILLAEQAYLPDGWKANVQVLVENGKISRVGPAGSFDAQGAVRQRGRVLLPGLVDCHTHLGLLDPTTPAGDDVNEMIDPVNPGLRVIDGVNPGDPGFGRALAEGVTSVGILPGSTNLLGGQGAVLTTAPGSLQERLLSSYCGMKAALGENPKRDYGAQQRSPRTRMGEAYLLRGALRRAAEALAAGRVNDYDTEALVRVLEGTVPLRVHVHRSDDVETILRIGEEFGLRLVLEHGTGCAGLADRLCQAGIVVAAGPAIMGPCKDEMRQITPVLPGMLEKAGVGVALITDAPEVPAEYLRLMGLIAHREGLSAAGTLDALTRVPARILGLEGQIGVIAPGARADLVWMNGDPLNLYSRVEKVFVGGACVYGEDSTD